MEEKVLQETGGIPTPTDTATETKSAEPQKVEVVEEVKEKETTKVEEPTTEKKVKTFTQEEVNEIVSKRLAEVKGKEAKSLCEKFGVADISELETKIAGNKTTREELLFLKNNIDADRYDDIRVFHRGLGEEISEESLAKYSKTHPEWSKKVSTVEKLGNDKRTLTHEDDTREVLKSWGV